MNSRFQTTLIVVLTLTTIVGGGLAWQQNHALAALRNTQAHTANDDRTALEKRLAEAERRARTLANELAMLKARQSNDDTLPGDPLATANDSDRRSRFRGPGNREAYLAMLNDPKAVQLMTNRQKLMLDSRYAALFKELTQGQNGADAMTPEQLDAFKNLLVEKENTLRDVMMTARSQGITDRNEINQLGKNAQQDLDAQLESTLGDAAYQQYQQYEQTLPQRALVNQLTQSLSYTATPLSDTQYDQLIGILAENSKTPSNSQIRTALGFGAGPGPSVYSGPTITDDAIAKAAGFLTPEQLLALKNLKDAQVQAKALRTPSTAATASASK